MSRLPDLGPRGEGWVALQGVLLVAVVLAGLAGAEPGGAGGPALSAAGVALVIAGGLLSLLGLGNLGRSLSPFPRPREGGEFVSRGAYRLVRHPIYGGMVIAALGYGLALHALAAGVVGSAVLLAFFTLKSAREEAWLVGRYPAYAEYRARTRRMLPFVF